MAQVKIHDIAYELPESFTLKEMRIIERYCQGNLEGWNISKMCGAIHVAIMRVKPEVPFEEIQDMIDNLAVEDVEAMFEKVSAAGQSPPAGKQNENGGSSSASSEPPSDADPESETPESSGSQGSAGFRSFHATSGT